MTIRLGPNKTEVPGSALNMNGVQDVTASGTYSGDIIATNDNIDSSTNVNRIVTPLKLQYGLEERMGNVSLAVGSIYAFRNIAGGTKHKDNTNGGGNLSWCNLEGTPKFSGGTVFVPNVGTWRCLGRATSSFSTSANAGAATLWVRIS